MKILIIRNMIILSCIILSGCFFKVDERFQSKVDLKKLELQTKAVVIVKGLYKEKALLGENVGLANFNISRIDDYYMDPSKKLSYQIKTNESLLSDSISVKPNILMIEPGEYVIENIRLKGENSEYIIDEPGKIADKIMFGSFNAKAGEVIYLGDINFKLKKKRNNGKKSTLSKLFGHKDFTVDCQLDDKFDKAKGLYNRKHPKSKIQPVKKLINISSS